MTITGTATVNANATVLTGGFILHAISGNLTVDAAATVIAGGALLKPSSGAFTLFIAGVDRTAYASAFPLQMETPEGSTGGGSGGNGFTRTWQVGSAGSSLAFSLNNTKGQPAYRPAKGDEVVVYVGTERWFDGFVNTYTETQNPGVTWVAGDVVANTYGAMLDRRYVAKQYIRPFAFLADIILSALIAQYFGDLGMTFGGSSGDSGADVGEPVFNFVTGTAALQQICDMCSWNFLTDMYKRVVCFPVGSGTGAAPFTLGSGHPPLVIQAVKDFGPYANSIIVRNSQDLNPIWTESYVGDGVSRLFLTQTTLASKPVIRVNGVAQIVTDPGVYSKPWDWYWLPYSIVQNPANAVLTSGDTLEVLYPSVLSFVWRAKDDAEIAAHGLFEYLLEVQDVTDLTIGQQLADGLLAIMKQDVQNISFAIDEAGLAPGQLLPVSLSAPPLSGDFLISEVDAQLLPNSFFRYSIKASNATLTGNRNDVVFFQKLLAATRQPKDRTTFSGGFTLAETIPGVTNPGLTTGLKNPVWIAPKPGFMKQITLQFQSTSTTLTTTDIQIDVLQNGTSIFASGGANKIVYPAGSTAVVNVFIFLTNPLQVRFGDVFTVDVIQADPLAMDGSLQMTVQG